MADQADASPMFDSIRGGSTAPSRLRPAVVVSLLAHVLLLALAVWFGAPKPLVPEKSVRIRIPLHPGPPAVAGSAPASTSASAPKVGRRAPPRTARAPRVAPLPDAPLERDVPREGQEHSGDGEPGDGTREKSGGPGQCGVPPCGGSDGEGLYTEDIVAALPVLLSGPEIVLPGDARRAGVEGTLLVRCVISASGAVTDCEIVKGLPLAEAAVIAALRERRYRPASVDGHSVAVRHVFRVQVTQPR